MVNTSNDLTPKIIFILIRIWSNVLMFGDYLQRKCIKYRVLYHSYYMPHLIFCVTFNTLCVPLNFSVFS